MLPLLDCIYSTKNKNTVKSKELGVKRTVVGLPFICSVRWRS